MLRPFFIAAALPLMLVLPAAHAAAEDMPTAKVRFADLDLSSAAGRDALRHRVMRAVDAVCGDVDNRDLVGLRLHADCHRSATSGAETQMASAIDRAQQALAMRDAARPTELAVYAPRH